MSSWVIIEIMSLKRTSSGGIDDEFAKKLKFMAKPNSCALSKSKVIYNREDDDIVNVIVRSIKTDTKFNAFGVGGEEAVKYVYYGSLAVLDAHKEEFAKKSKYGGDKLIALLDRISPEDREEMQRLVNSDGSINELPDTSVQRAGKFAPQVMMKKTEKNGDDGGGDAVKKVNGVYLYMSEAVNMVKYMNSTMNIGNSPLRVAYEVKTCDDDAVLF